MMQKNRIFLLLSFILASCSFDRDPAWNQTIQLDLQGLLSDDINSSDYSAFQANPCVVLRYCGGQMGCNETPAEEMTFSGPATSGSGILDTATVSFRLSLAEKQKYHFQVLGYPKASGSCSSLGSNPIQMGLGDSTIKKNSFIRIAPNYQPAGSFSKISSP